ncbi:MAG: dihydrolipoyl dehydrogenase [Planctomycetota bacterium]
MANRHFDVVVIGGGPGGYVGAIRAAQLGYKVAIVDRAKLGGVCLNWGCIPSKALLSNAELMEKLSHQEDWGLKIEGSVSFDWSKVIGRSRDVASKLNKGVEFLMKKNKVEHIVAHAKVLKGATDGSPCRIAIHDVSVEEELTSAPVDVHGEKETITADRIVVATGSVARELPNVPFDGDKVWGAREAMYNQEKPKKMVVVGSGAIGMEFTYFYRQFGTEITVVEMQDRILPVEDSDVSKAMLKTYKKMGVDFRLGSITTGVEKTDSGVKVTVAPFRDGSPVEAEAEVLEADKVLVAIGVVGRTDGLFEDALGIEMERGHIKTDYVPLNMTAAPMDPPALEYTTSVPGIYAIGDVIGAPWLAHVASEEAILCVERFAVKDGKLDHEPHPLDYSVIPGCTYCQPQVASVGYTEDALKARGLKKGEDYEVGQFPFTALGKAIASAHTDGFVKIIRGLPHGEVLGAHIMGDQATELIAEMSLARRLEATSEDLIATVHAHPTMHESVHEAALASESRVIHM